MTLALAAALSLLSNLSVAQDTPEAPAAADTPAVEAPAVEAAPLKPAPAPSVAYTVNDADSLLYVVLNAPEDSKAHDHVVKAGQVSGSVTWGESGREISVSFPVSALAPDLNEMRAMVGFEDTLKDKHQAKVKKHLLAENQLDGATYETISFTSTSITESEAGWLVKGEMKIHGQTASVETLLSVKTANGMFIGTGSFEIQGSDFGFEPYAKGPYFNPDTMTVHVKLAAKG